MIGFTNNKSGQVEKPVENEKLIVYLTNTTVVLNNNGLLFKNNVEYAYTKCMQDSKMTKKIIRIFFNNPDLASMQEHLSYKT